MLTDRILLLAQAELNCCKLKYTYPLKFCLPLLHQDHTDNPGGQRVRPTCIVAKAVSNYQKDITGPNRTQTIILTQALDFPMGFACKFLIEYLQTQAEHENFTQKVSSSG